MHAWFYEVYMETNNCNTKVDFLLKRQCSNENSHHLLTLIHT